MISTFTGGLNKLRNPVEVSAVVGLMFLSLPSAASTGSSWTQQPAWASPEQSSPSRKNSLSRAEGRFNPNISPYSPGSNNVAIDVGQVFLMGDLASHYADNIGMQIHYTYGVSEIFGFDSSFGYSDHSDGRYSMTTLLTGLRTNLAWYDKVVPYFVFGMGFYRPSIEVTQNAPTSTNPGATISSSVAPILFGVHMGPGVDLELTRQLFFGAALTFHDVFGGQRSYDSIGKVDVGGTYTSFLLHAGYTF